MLGLGAADFRLGQAYGLGQGLADTCLGPEDAESFDRAFGPQLAAVKNWLADLTSALSPHAGRSVMRTLRVWEIWAAEPKLDGRPLDWQTEGAGVRAALRRQGELWRTLLSGEKQGHDMLKTTDYLKAGRAMLKRLRWAVVAISALVLLVGVGIVLLAVGGTAGKVLGAVATVAGTVGLTGAGIRARLSSAATQLESRLWGAELDGAVAEAVLTGPTAWGVSLDKADDVPASGVEPRVAANLEILRQCRQAVGEGNARRIKKLLAADVRFTADGQMRADPNEISALVLGAEQKHIAKEPQTLVAGRPSFILAYVDGGADVWRLREGKIRSWQRFGDANEARQAAGLRGPNPTLHPEMLRP